MNGKKDLQKTNTRKGTGIENVRKRLDLLYKNKYDLKITEDDEVFVVNLAMELVKITPTAIAQMPPPTVLKKEYA
jgi:two-component system, LytTR family, sensor kinase